MDPQLLREIMDFKVHNRMKEGLTKHERWTIKRRASNFVLKDGVLHYMCRRRKDKQEHLAMVVTSAAQAEKVFQDLHCSSLGAHCGVDKTQHAIISHYYWPGKEADIRKWIAQCPDCQAKQPNLKEKQYNPIEVTEPFELVGMDLVKLTKTEGGNQYICVMVDYFTKWVEAYPLKSKCAEEVTKCILEFVYKFGAPQRLLTDQGTEFKNQVNARLCESLGIKRSFCAPYHPQTNGLVEKLNGTIQRSLNKLSCKQPNKWDTFLQATMFGLRTKKQLTTQHSPYYLLFGREARYPSEVAEDYEVLTEKVQRTLQREEPYEGLTKQPLVYDIVKENVKRTQEKIRKRKLEKGWEDNFKVGDKVLKTNIREQQRKGGKMERDMLGPFKITSVEGKVISLSDKTTKTIANVDQLTPFIETIANVDQLTPFIEPEERIPAKLKHVGNSPLAPPSPTDPDSSQPSQPPATSSDSDPIHDIWKGGKGEILWAKISPYMLFTADLQSLAPGRELESEIVNAYLTCLAKTQKYKVKVIDTFEMTAIWNGTSRGMKKLDIMEWDILIGAVCKDRHWTLIAIYPKDGFSKFADPFGATEVQLRHCRDSTRPQITLTCIFKIAEMLLQNTAIDFGVEESDINRLRLEIARTLMADSDDIAELCLICGRKEADESDKPMDHWIECTACLKWYHWVCAGKPKTDDTYFCPVC